MENSSTKTCYIEAGTYHLTSSAGAACSDPSGSTGLVLGPADAGETWSYDPAAGYDTAIIDGGSAGLGTGICIQTDNVTIDGLQIQNFQNSLINDLGGQNALIENNIVHGTYTEPFSGAITLNANVQGSHIVHNVVYDVASNGIRAQSCNGGDGGCSQGISNVLVAYNTVYNYCSSDWDCGAISFTDHDTPRSTNIVAEYNYVRDGDLSGGALNGDGGGRGGAMALYADDGTSNVTFKGNVVTGKQWSCSLIHGGSNVALTGNICDLQTPVSGDNASNGSRYLTYFQWSSMSAGMTGGTIDGNVNVSNIAGGGDGYAVDMLGSDTIYIPSVYSNGYHNYAGAPTGSCYVDGVNDCVFNVNGGGTDASPVSVGSTFNTCPTDGADSWSFELTGTAPAGFSEAANDLGIAWGHPGYWGPPGYTIPHSGNAPSYGPTC